jgi:Protein of unknown function (DUF2934)
MMTPMNSLPVTAATATDFSLSHDEIAQCARELWTESGQPEGRDQAIWFEAERRLVSERRAPLKPAVVPQATAHKSPPKPVHEKKDRRPGGNQKHVMGLKA